MPRRGLELPNTPGRRPLQLPRRRRAQSDHLYLHDVLAAFGQLRPGAVRAQSPRSRAGARPRPPVLRKLRLQLGLLDEQRVSRGQWRQQLPVIPSACGGKLFQRTRRDGAEVFLGGGPRANGPFQELAQQDQDPREQVVLRGLRGHHHHHRHHHHPQQQPADQRRRESEGRRW